MAKLKQQASFPPMLYVSPYQGEEDFYDGVANLASLGCHNGDVVARYKLVDVSTVYIPGPTLTQQKQTTKASRKASVK